MLMEPLWTSRELALALNVQIDSPWYTDGLQIDSREVLPGDVFVALTAGIGDGHAFCEKAFAAGAVAAVVDKSWLAAQSAHIRTNPRYVGVENTLDALADMARHALSRAPANIIGVTGSVGKTSTVQMLRRALEASGPTHASVKSYNNHVGVPLSLARMGRQTRYGLFEMGMSAPGEIEYLTHMVRPDVAIVTSVGAAHHEAFSSVEDIAEAKAEIFKGVKRGGKAVLAVDHPYAGILEARAREHGLDVITVSARSNEADVQLKGLNMQDGCTAISADVMGTRVTFRMNQPGGVWVTNALTVLAATKAVGADLTRAAMSLASVKAEPGRGRLYPLTFERGDLLVIDDSYNANPVSMAAALERLGATNPTQAGARRLAVLGDMEELGAQSTALHLGLVAALKMSGAEKLFVLGAGFEAAGNAAGISTERCDNLDDLRTRLLWQMHHGDVVLVKGSNAAGLGGFVNTLIQRSERSERWGGNIRYAAL